MIPRRLTDVYKDTEGRKFHGLFAEPQSTFADDESEARRVLQVDKDVTFLDSGSIIKAHGERYLLVHHSSAGSQKRYLAYMITQDVVWTQQVITKDPVTKMDRATSEVTRDLNFPIVVQPVNPKEVLNMERVKYRIRSGPGVLAGDMLGPYQVHVSRDIQGKVCVIDAY